MASRTYLASFHSRSEQDESVSHQVSGSTCWSQGCKYLVISCLHNTLTTWTPLLPTLAFHTDPLCRWCSTYLKNGFFFFPRIKISLSSQLLAKSIAEETQCVLNSTLTPTTSCTMGSRTALYCPVMVQNILVKVYIYFQVQIDSVGNS